MKKTFRTRKDANLTPVKLFSELTSNAELKRRNWDIWGENCCCWYQLASPAFVGKIQQQIFSRLQKTQVRLFLLFSNIYASVHSYF